MFWLGFLIGGVVGGAFGAFVMALAVTAARNDRRP